MEKQIKEYEEIFLWIDRQITSADSIIKLVACESLIVNFFLERKFKDKPPAKKMKQLSRLLLKSIERKKSNLHLRNHREQQQNKK